MINPQNHFDQRSKEWDQDPAKVARAVTVAELIRRKLAGKSFRTAMEYGCGTGLLSQALANNFADITLADTSEGMLAVLSEKVKEHGLKHFHPVNLDLITDTTYPVGTVDVIYSLLTLHHIQDTQMILTRFAKIIKPGGYVFLADLDKEDGSFHPAGTTEIHFGFERDLLATLASQAGFSGIHFETAFEIQKGTTQEPRIYPVFIMSAIKPLNTTAAE